MEIVLFSQNSSFFGKCAPLGDRITAIKTYLYTTKKMHQVGLQNPWYTAESTTEMAMGSSAAHFTPGVLLQFP